MVNEESEAATFAVILTFDTHEHYDEWMTSDERNFFVSQANARGVHSQVINEYGGLSESDTKAMGLLGLDKKVLRVKNANKPSPPPVAPNKWKLAIIILSGVFISNVGNFFIY